MKKHIRFYLPEAIAVLLLLMFTTSKVLAQSMTPLAPLAANSTVGFDSLMKVYKSNLFIDLGNDTPRVNKQLARIANVWDYRTSNTIPAGYDRFSAAGKAFKTAANDRNSLCENRHPDFNGSWEFLGPKNLPVQEYGVNWDVWIDPTNSNTILVGGYGGIFKTTNANAANGPDWVNITDGGNNVLPSGFMVTSITVHPTNPNIIYAGTSIQLDGREFYNVAERLGIGIIKSTDGGFTWEVDDDFNSICNSDRAHITDVQFNQNGDYLYILSNKGIYIKSTLTGWHQLHSSAWGRNVELRPGFNNQCWISEGGQPFMNVYHVVVSNPSIPMITITPMANGFENLPIGGGNTMGPCWHFEISAFDANTLYAMTNRATFGASMCCSEHGGSSCNWPGPEAVLWRYDMTTAVWTMINRSSNTPHTLPTFAFGGFCFAKSKANPNIMYYGRDVLYISTDEGLSFQQISTYWTNNDATRNHADINSIKIYTASTGNTGVDDIVYFTTDGGLGIKKAGVIPNSATSSVNHTGSGIGCNQFYGMGTSEAGGMMMGGCMHDGTHSFEPSKTPQWHHMKSGDDFQAIFDGTNPNKGYLKNQSNSFLISSSNANRTLNSFLGSISPQELDRQTYITPFFTDSRGRLYWPQARLWRYENNQLNLVNNEISNGVSQAIPNFNGTDLLLPDNNTNIHRIAVDLDEPDNTNNNILHGYIAYQWGGDPAGAKRLFRRKTNSTEIPKWQDKTPTDAFDKKITDIQMDKNQPNRVWVSLGDVTAGNTNTARVLYSDNWGDDWIDMSDGLPREIPVNCIVHQPGTNTVYAGTDIGVFMLNFNTGNPSQSYWTCFNDGKPGHPNLPPNMLMKLEINHCSGKLVMASHGRGIWQSDLYHETPDVAGVGLIINSNTTWGDNSPGSTVVTNKYIKGSILVKSGNTLTIRGNANVTNNTSNTTVYMPKNGVINVERGAKLLIDGARITNDCQSYWYGIRAFGDDVSGQILNANLLYTNQGLVEIKHHGIIEHADFAFENGGGAMNPQAGGVIWTNEAIFLNNRKSLGFVKYSNIQNGQLYKDASKIINSEFIVNDDMHKPFETHISMWAVNGVLLKGNHFTNLKNLNTSHYHAIYTIDASYELQSGSNTSLLENFHKAIESTSFTYKDFSPIRIESNVFDRNEIAIHMNNMGYPLIISNDLHIGDKQTPYPSGTNWTYYSLGSKLDHVSNFVYCQNNHEKMYDVSPNGDVYTAGTEVYKTGQADQLIEHNTYKDLLIGNDCAFECGLSNSVQGLWYQCNTNIDNTRHDFLLQADAVVRKVQNSYSNSSAGAGNTFSNAVNVPFTSHWSHINSPNGNPPIDYYFGTGTFEEPTNNLVNVTVLPSDPSECTFADCRSLLTRLAYTQEISNSELNGLKSNYNVIESEFLNYKLIYLQTIDAGNTPGTISNIQGSINNEAFAIRAEMLARSPYVSYDVLKTLAYENVLPSSFLLEILVANPDATKSEEFVKELEFEIPSPLPSYMISMIRNSWNGLTLRTMLEQNMASRHSKMTVLRNEIISIHRTSPNQYNKDSIRYWLGKADHLKGKYEFIEHCLNEGLFTQAENALAEIPIQFELNENDNTELSAYTALYNFKKSLIQDNIEINQLDATRINQLKSIADVTEFTFPRDMARNALCFFYQICYPDLVRELPVIESKIASSAKDNTSDKQVTVYPNPAKEFVTFYYNFANGNEALQLQIMDIVGKVVYSQKLTDKEGQHIWDTRAVSDGNYIYTLSNTFGEKYSGKITIKK